MRICWNVPVKVSVWTVEAALLQATARNAHVWKGFSETDAKMMVFAYIFLYILTRRAT